MARIVRLCGGYAGTIAVAESAAAGSFAQDGFFTVDLASSGTASANGRASTIQSALPRRTAVHVRGGDAFPALESAKPFVLTLLLLLACLGIVVTAFTIYHGAAPVKTALLRCPTVLVADSNALTILEATFPHAFARVWTTSAIVITQRHARAILCPAATVFITLRRMPTVTIIRS